MIVGMTGSGKTGLVTVLVEEALRAGGPMLEVHRGNVIPAGDRMSRTSLPFLVALHAALLLVLLVPLPATAVGPGGRAPEIGLPDMHGHRVTLAGLRGKVVIVDTWASWCPPCAAEFAALERLYRQHHAQGLEIVAVSADNEASNVRAFVARLQPTFPVVHDAAHAVIPRYAPPGWPSTFFVDKRGIVRFVHAGFHANTEPAAFEREVTQLLAAR